MTIDVGALVHESSVLGFEVGWFVWSPLEHIFWTQQPCSAIAHAVKYSEVTAVVTGILMLGSPATCCTRQFFCHFLEDVVEVKKRCQAGMCSPKALCLYLITLYFCIAVPFCSREGCNFLVCSWRALTPKRIFLEKRAVKSNQLIREYLASNTERLWREPRDDKWDDDFQTY